MNYSILVLLAGFLLFGCLQWGGGTPANATASNASLPLPTNSIPTIRNSSVQLGDVVFVEYVGKLEDGTVFDTNIQEEAQKAGLPLRPSYELLSFQVGSGQVIRGFEDAVKGMKIGEKKTATIPPEEGYGLSRPEEILVANRSELNMSGVEPEIGVLVYSETGRVGNVTQVNETHVTIDFNHRLAGKTLVFEITLRRALRRGSTTASP